MPETKLNDEKVLQMFVDRLIADKGGDTLEAKQKEILQGELLEELDERMQSAMIKALPDAKLMELEGMLDAEAPDEEIENFFANAGVSFDEPLKKAMDEFRTDYFRGKIKTSVKLPAEAPKAGVQPVVSATETVAMAEAPKVEAQPVQGATSAVPGRSDVNGVADVVNVVTPVQQVTPAQAAPLQAAPDLMDALNAATANLNATTANLNPAGNVAPVDPVTDATAGNMNAGINTNNGMTGEEA